jgi:hypothetical protein
MADFPAADFSPIFDFGKKLRLNPDAAMRNLFRVGLRLLDQLRQFLAQFRRRGLRSRDRLAEMSVLLPAADMRERQLCVPEAVIRRSLVIELLCFDRRRRRTVS